MSACFCAPQAHSAAEPFPSVAHQQLCDLMSSDDEPHCNTNEHRRGTVVQTAMCAPAPVSIYVPSPAHTMGSLAPSTRPLCSGRQVHAESGVSSAVGVTTRAVDRGSRSDTGVGEHRETYARKQCSLDYPVANSWQTGSVVKQDELVINIAAKLPWRVVGSLCTSVCKRWLSALTSDILWSRFFDAEFPHNAASSGKKH